MEEARPDVSARSRRRVAPFVAIALAVVVGGLFWTFVAADPTRNETADTNLMGRPAPDAVGDLADGSRFELSRRKGDWVVLNFFQSSCVPCQQEHPELVAFAEQQAATSDGVRLYTIVYDDNQAEVEAFFAGRGGDWPVVYDIDGSIAVAFGVSKVPETWIIDPTGVIRGRIISQVTADFLTAQINRLRNATPPPGS